MVGTFFPVVHLKMYLDLCCQVSPSLSGGVACGIVGMDEVLLGLNNYMSF